MLKNLTIKSRLVFVISFLSFQLVVGGVIGIVSLAFTNNKMQSLYDDRLVPTAQLNQVIRLLTINQLTVAKAITDNPANASQAMNDIEADIAKINKAWDAYMATRLTPEEKKTAGDFVASRQKYTSEALLPVMAAVRTGDFPKAMEILHGPMTKLFIPVRGDMNKLIQIQLDTAKQEFEESQTLYRLVRNSCIAGILFGLLLAAFIGTWLVRAITIPINGAVKIAGAIAAGDLTQRIEVRSTDETGRLMQALKNMNDSLVKIVTEVRSGTDTINSASSQISAGNLDLSSRTEQQASSLEETASSMEELTSTVKQNADNARQANTLASSASDVAVKGGAVVSEVVDTMSAINASSQKIADIIGVIDGIAFQTNILALNAAVEAARAGEQGRGFAVVASEVRSLAQRSAAAAKEIKDLITDSVEKVDAGTRLVDQAGATMQEIVDSVKRVTDIMSEIAAASQEQTAGIEQVNQAISQMDEVTQQNASLVEQAAAASQAMQDQAASLAQVVSVFKLDQAQPASPASSTAVRQPASLPAKAKPQIRKASPKTDIALAAPQSKRLTNTPPGDGDWEQF